MKNHFSENREAQETAMGRERRCSKLSRSFPESSGEVGGKEGAGQIAWGLGKQIVGLIGKEDWCEKSKKG